jgi:hypothetical protein
MFPAAGLSRRAIHGAGPVWLTAVNFNDPQILILGTWCAFRPPMLAMISADVTSGRRFGHGG